MFASNLAEKVHNASLSMYNSHTAVLKNQLLPPAVTLVLYYLPLGIGAFILVRDVLTSIRPSNPLFRVLYRVLRFLVRPFRDYMQLEDMAEYDPDHPVIIESPQWKKWFLVSVGGIVGIAWGVMTLFIAAITEIFHETDPDAGKILFYLSSMTFFWIYSSLRLLLRPLRAAPVGNILFYLLHSLMALDLIADEFFASGHVPFPFVAEALFALAALFVAGTLPVSPVQPSNTVASPKAIPTSACSSPEDSVSFWQWVTFSFPSLYYTISMTRRLELEDVWSLSPRFLHANIFRKYLSLEDSRTTTQEKTKDKKSKPRSLIVFLLRANSADIILDITIEMYKAVAGFIPPYALKQLLAILSLKDDSPPDTIWGNKWVQAHFWALVTLVAHLSFAQCDLAQGWCTRRCYERTRGTIFCALHWKALRRRVVGGASTEAKDAKEEGEDDTANVKVGPNGLEEEKSADLGKVVNLMQGDAYAVAQRFWELSPLFGAPVRIGIALWFLYDLLGPSAFAGVGVILFAYVINVPLIKWNLYITRQSWKSRDKRMTGVNELFQSIRFLKLMGWENGWSNRVLEWREQELGWRVQENICSAILIFIWTWIPSATALASFVAYTLVSGKPLTVSVAFTALGVFSQLQSSMTQLPGHIFAMFHAWISMQRINTFLREEEVPDWASSLKRANNPPNHEQSATEQAEKIGYENATLEWHRVTAEATKKSTPGLLVDEVEAAETRVETEAGHPRLDLGQPLPLPDPTQEVNAIEAEARHAHHSNAAAPPGAEGRIQPFKLHDLNVFLPPGKLTLVTGITGAGKTAFLVGLLGEMNLLHGIVHLDKSSHRVAYCAQSPWIEHATIRDNIVYASPAGYDEARYDAVISACALERDLEILPAGDMTEIGEKGVSLSGGQRARVALARAIYSPARTILLDDPLAAVDMHTARHLVEHCFGGPLMAGRTIILVTHHVSLCLPLAEYLVEIGGGRLERHGSVAELKKRGILDDIKHEPEEWVEEPSEKVINDVDGLPSGTNSGDKTPSSSTNVAESNQNPDLDTKAKPSWKLSTAELGKLVDEEARAEGRVSWDTYKTYIKAAGYWTWFTTVLLMILIRAVQILDQFYLSKWGEAYNHPTSNATSILASIWEPVTQTKVRGPPLNLTSSGSLAPILDSLPPPDENVRPWLLIYFGISLLGAFTVLGFISLGFYSSLQASRSLFTHMLHRLSRAPARFYDVTPVGRILNRFVADMGAIDGAVNNSARSAIGGALSFVSSFGVIVYVVPMFAPIALFIAWLYIRLAPPYVRTSRDLRRLESISLSPAFAGFDELLHGLIHVRAFGVEQRYQNRFYKRVDTFQAFDHSYWLVAFWLRWRYDCLGSVVVYLTTIFAITAGVSTGFSAVVILNAGIFAEASRQLVKVLAQVELDFNSVERVGEYLNVAQEAPAIIENRRPPAYWPSSTSGIMVNDLWVRYSANSPDVLRGLSFQIAPGEKIGVVGRTGSGKTTLCAAFLRIIEAHRGQIIVDGIDISTIGLEDLRTRLTVVSQDVALFEGSVRFNLDPFDEHSDQECWDVLQRCHLVAQSTRTSEGGPLSKKRKALFDSLESPISFGGSSLSAGQRQLVALARAMLRRSQIVLTDEATSAIDLDLDDQIQQTIREELGDATVITIAHRLRTVIEYDRILVLSHGEIVEFDSPAELLRRNGAFAALCRGSADWEQLKSLVKEP
ncbi:hypothetical protein M408DRAFT_329592 [Serendipita vermifera MAFF 305830]|uniref:Uncharacterized protein n=1 Tax=Serendipita vermifera MAFF 305830 TaxID=933852 RepID=A0A0C2XGJ4_SERVB|nr:hypothetical protein M408DRAFT_329592 [Serendipita vermifera MAFF 305830]